MLAIKQKGFKNENFLQKSYLHFLSRNLRANTIKITVKIMRKNSVSFMKMDDVFIKAIQIPLIICNL